MSIFRGLYRGMVSMIKGPAPKWECGHNRVDTMYGALKWRLSSVIYKLDASVDTEPGQGVEGITGGHYVHLFWRE
jgi:hypothetical protein